MGNKSKNSSSHNNSAGSNNSSSNNLKNSSNSSENQNKKQQEAERNQAYNDYVEDLTPKHNLWVNMAKAFVLGGAICLVGQVITNIAKESFGLEQDIAASWCSTILILCSILLTCFNIYPSIANWGGAGALVPITGFANGVCAPAVEFKVEGEVFGKGTRIFQIAGPVILYGVFSSWVLGLGYWILVKFGVF